MDEQFEEFSQQIRVNFNLHFVEGSLFVELLELILKQNYIQFLTVVNFEDWLLNNSRLQNGGLFELIF